MKRLLFLSALFACFVSHAGNTLTAKSKYSGSWKTYDIAVLDSISNYTPVVNAKQDFTINGSCAYLTAVATGYYHVAKINGRWWLIDPDGHAGINMAVTSLSTDSVSYDYRLLRRNYFNGTGNFLSDEDKTQEVNDTCASLQMSYTRRCNFYASYRKVRHNYYSTPAALQKNDKYIFVLDPQFAVFCKQLAVSNVKSHSSERNMLGWFTDNELPFDTSQLRLFTANLSAGDPTYDSTLVWINNRKLNLSACAAGTVADSVKEAFAAYLARHYYSVVCAAIRDSDPNHMILGSRLHGTPRRILGVVQASHDFCDVTSVNFYDRFCPNNQIALPEWTNDHPCLVSEFYIKDIHFLSAEQDGAGWYVGSQVDRGRWYQNTCLQLIQNKCFIGWQYFRFMDDTSSNKGLVSASRVEYVDMTHYVEQINSQVYRLIDFFDNTSICTSVNAENGNFEEQKTPDWQLPVFNILGQRVKYGYHGIAIQNNHKFLLK